MVIFRQVSCNKVLRLPVVIIHMAKPYSGDMQSFRPLVFIRVKCMQNHFSQVKQEVLRKLIHFTSHCCGMGKSILQQYRLRKGLQRLSVLGGTTQGPM